MAVLISKELAALRRAASDRRITEMKADPTDKTGINWDKGTINAASQAIEDQVVANEAAILVAIDTATSPFVFSAAQKRNMLTDYSRQKWKRG